MTEFKVGDIVRTIGPNNIGFTIGQIDPTIPNMFRIQCISPFSGQIHLVDFENNDQCYWHSSSLELIDDKKSNTAKIFTEKVWKDGVQCRKIVGWENVLDYTHLPDRYCVLNEMFYFKHNVIRLRGFKDELIVLVNKEDIIEERRYQDILKFMRECGHKLYEINKKLREEEKKKKWSGYQVDEI